ncbi:hypothetical protein JA13_226 [Dickeya phage vB_DsoM_JA13]|uniref:Uncharacterized protein n=1 Tax=Dickeya phage vB_DsoM_JA13 TaxID=2283030 RepID=A0A384ZWM1_9CAUD|nr:hypothetical protein JA13_226 [Dickeya phage vB_DsoM_JA13]
MKINFVNDTNPKAYRVGLSVFSDSPEMEKRITDNFNKQPDTLHYSRLTQIVRDRLCEFGVNIPFECGAVLNPVYVIAFRSSFLAVPLRLVQFIAEAHREVYDQAEAFAGCPRQELAASVTATLQVRAIELGYLNLDFRISDSMDLNILAGSYSVHVDFSNQVLEITHEKVRHVGTIDYILLDLFGEHHDCSH